MIDSHHTTDEYEYMTILSVTYLIIMVELTTRLESGDISALLIVKTSAEQ